MGLIIGLAGPDGVGKTSVAQALGIQCLSFADPLKSMISVLLEGMRYTPEQGHAMLYGNRKDVQIPMAMDKTARYLMRTLGAEWGRDLVSPNLWSDIGINRALRHVSSVFDDVRFLGEAMAIKTVGGFLFEITRDGIDYSHAHRADEGLQGFTQIKNTTPQEAASAIWGIVNAG